LLHDVLIQSDTGNYALHEILFAQVKTEKKAHLEMLVTVGKTGRPYFDLLVRSGIAPLERQCLQVDSADARETWILVLMKVVSSLTRHPSATSFLP
jgi:hypothetical protein